MKSAYLFFDGTYNFSIATGKHVHPRSALGVWPNGAVYIPRSLGKCNCPALLDDVFSSVAEDVEAVVFCGTDSVEEAAFLFSLNRPVRSTTIFAGAMFPYDHPLTDGLQSLQTLTKVRDHLTLGSWLVVGEGIHDGYRVRKQASIGCDAFGPHATAGLDGMFRSDAPMPIACMRPSSVSARVPIWTVGLGGAMEGLDARGIDGMVIAGSGTGSIPDAMLDAIIPLAARIPVVVSTRCMAGPNHAEDLYPRSAERYEAHGLKVRAYAGLNPLQARIRLMIEISASRTRSWLEDELRVVQHSAP